MRKHLFWRTVTTLTLLALASFAAAQTPKVKPGAGDDLRAVYATAADIAEGKGVADSSCARCHGASGISTTRGIPHVAGQRAAYLYQQLRAYQLRLRSKNPSPMESVVKFLRDDALVKVAAYYASLEPARPAPATGTKTPAADVDPLQAGKAAAGACGGCHGEKGVSGTPGMPSLAGLDPKYFVSAMNAYKGGQRRNEMMKPFAGLSEPVIANVALYYALLKPARAQTPAAGDQTAGRKAATSCGGCHGDTGVSSSPGTPSLAGQDAQYLVAATQAYKDGSRRDDTMKDLATPLDERAMKDIASFYAAQQPQPPAVRKPLSLAELTERCDRCHGANGNSSEPLMPALAGQRADWLEPVLEAYRTGARQSKAMAAMASLVSETDVKALAAHYSRQTARPVVYVLVPAR